VKNNRVFSRPISTLLKGTPPDTEAGLGKVLLGAKERLENKRRAKKSRHASKAQATAGKFRKGD